MGLDFGRSEEEILYIEILSMQIWARLRDGEKNYKFKGFNLYGFLLVNSEISLLFQIMECQKIPLRSINSWSRPRYKLERTE